MLPEPIESDWLDVQRRARASRKRHLMAYALAATFAIVLVGCTAVFGPRIVKFADSDPSPAHVLDELIVSEAAAIDYDPNLPGFDERETRRVVDREFAGGRIAIDMTPLRGGGFCFLVDGDGGGGGRCLTPARLRAEPLGFHGLSQSTETGGGTPGKHEGGVSSFLGWVASTKVDEIELRYEDGATAKLDFFRVTEPIGTAFFLFDVPGANLSYPRRASELRALDSRGNVITQLSILPIDPGEWTFPRFGSRNGKPHHGFPPAADESLQRRLMFPGAAKLVWVAPAKGGAMCFIVHDPGGSGSDFCTHDAGSRRDFRLDENDVRPWGSSALLWGLVEPAVRRVDFRFQDGARDTTAAHEGLVIYTVPERQHAPGKRLVAATLRDSEGSVVRRIAFDPTIRDRYPCDNPKSVVEFGPKHCP